VSEKDGELGTPQYEVQYRIYVGTCTCMDLDTDQRLVTNPLRPPSSSGSAAVQQVYHQTETGQRIWHVR